MSNLRLLSAMTVRLSWLNETFRSLFHRLTSFISQPRSITAEEPDGSDQSTFSQEEGAKFGRLASEWWDEYGPMRGLHTMNGVRVPFIRDGLIETGVVSSLEAEQKPPDQVLSGIRIVDIGCGCGILTEALGRLGASVTGLEPVQECVDAANEHLLAMQDSRLQNNVNYICASAEDHLQQLDQKYDCVVASEVIEHVTNPALFVGTCASLLRPGGSLFITTLNRTFLSYAVAIVGAEYIMREIPIGTHDWSMFIRPDELREMCSKHSLFVRSVRGTMINPFNRRWDFSRSSHVFYMLHAVKS